MQHNATFKCDTVYRGEMELIFLYFIPFAGSVAFGSRFSFVVYVRNTHGLLKYMAKEYAKAFYSSKRWQDCRNAYGKSKGWLCENCLRSGIYNPGEIVHHKIEISPVNINTPEIALAWDNLADGVTRRNIRTRGRR